MTAIAPLALMSAWLVPLLLGAQVPGDTLSPGGSCAPDPRFMASLYVQVTPACSGDDGLAVGAGVGACLRERFLVGLYGEVLLVPWTVRGRDPGDSSAELFFGHAGAWMQYALVTGARVHPCVSARAGFGFAARSGSGSSARGTQEGSLDGVAVFAPSVGAEWTLGWRIRLGLLAGYRFVRDVSMPDLSSTDLDGPFVGLNILLDAFSDR